MTDAMEAIATNALLKPAIGTGIDHCFLWEVTVVGCVEDGDLGDIAQDTLNCLDPFQILRIMQWRERCKVLNFGFDIWCDQDALMIMWSPMNNAMSNDINICGLRDNLGFPA